MTQDDFAKSINVWRYETISRWENDAGKPNAGNLAALARFIEVPIDELRSFLNNDRPLTTVPKQMRCWIDHEATENKDYSNKELNDGMGR